MHRNHCYIKKDLSSSSIKNFRLHRVNNCDNSNLQNFLTMGPTDMNGGHENNDNEIDIIKIKF